jgi:uncharacterized membrane protein YczE
LEYVAACFLARGGSCLVDVWVGLVVWSFSYGVSIYVSCGFTMVLHDSVMITLEFANYSEMFVLVQGLHLVTA